MARIIMIILLCLFMAGCSSQTELQVSTPKPEGIPASTPESSPQNTELKPDTGYNKITKMPEIKQINKRMLDMPQPEAEKAMTVVFETDAKIRSHPVEQNGILFFGDSNGRFYAYDLANSKLAWTYEAGIRIITKPVIDGDKVLFNAGNSLFCLNTHTGEELWKYSREVDPSMRGITGSQYDYHEVPIALYEGKAYYPANDGSITAVDVETGKEAWRNVSEFPVPVTSGLNIWEDKLYYNTLMGDLYCLDLKTHKTVFKVAHNDPLYAPMLIQDGTIYFAGRSTNAYAVNAKTGEVLWITKVPTKLSWYSGGPVIIGQDIYFPTSDEFSVVVLDRKTGDYQKMYRTNYNVFTQTLLYKEQLIVVDCEVRSKAYGSIIALDTKTENRRLWHVKIDEGLLSSPVIVDNKVYLGSDKGKIYCVDLE